VEQAKSAGHVIVTCEEMVPTDKLRENPDMNQIPFFCVDAVAEVPYGAYPTACYRYYDYDPIYLKNYRKSAQEETLHKTYLKQLIYGTRNHGELLELQGKERLSMIQSDPRTGYASGLDRR
jgi:glutaconate CoA-transferase subunit A